MGSTVMVYVVWDDSDGSTCVCVYFDRLKLLLLFKSRQNNVK